MNHAPVIKQDSGWHAARRIAITGPEPHRLTEKDEENKTCVCSICGPVGYVVRGGYGVCRTRWRERERKRRWKVRERGRAERELWLSENARSGKTDHRRFATMVCSRCGFQAQEIAQMDVHHKDEDRTNNHKSNLESLCACCHRLRHVPNKSDYLVLKPAKPPELVKEVEDTGVSLNRPQEGLESLELAEMRRHVAAMLEDLDKYSVMVADRDRTILDLQRGVTDPYVQALRTKIRELEAQVRRLES